MNIPGKQSDSQISSGNENPTDHSEPMICNLFTKLLHSFFLDYLQSEVLHLFYQSHPIKNDSIALENEQILYHIWNENNQTPAFYINKLLRDAENLFLAQNLSMYSLLDNFFEDIFAMKNIFTNMEIPILQILSKEIDIRKYLLHTVHCIPPAVCANAKCDVITSIENEMFNFRLFALTQNGKEYYESTMDAELIFAQIIRLLPMMFCQRPFSYYEILFQEQKIEERGISGADIEYIKGNCLINGEVYGYQDNLKNIIESRYSELSLKIDINPVVTFISKDYYCPVRKRNILKENIVYGAPFSLVWIYDEIKTNSNKGNNENRNVNLWKILEQRQTDLIKMWVLNVTVVYDKKVQIIFVNDKPLVGGVQAKILSTVLKVYVEKKCELFEWRDLAAIDELICDPFSTGLSTRLNRLITKLKKVNCGITIDKLNRGKYKLKIDCTIEYSEKK
jgi:hypothetical protein